MTPTSRGTPGRSSATGACLGGATVWFTGPVRVGQVDGGRRRASARLLEAGRAAYLLDGDNLRHGLNGDLGFSAEDRSENIRRVGEVARLFADAGVIALVPVISPYRADRERARAAHDDAPGCRSSRCSSTRRSTECEARDPKGLYAKARAGEIKGFTGIDDPYEAPVEPELRLTPDDGAAEEQASRVLALLTD